MSNTTGTELPVTVIKVPREEKTFLWPKSRASWMHVYRNYLNHFDWFLKADTDSCKMWEKYIVEIFSLSDYERVR